MPRKLPDLSLKIVIVLIGCGTDTMLEGSFESSYWNHLNKSFSEWIFNASVTWKIQTYTLTSPAIRSISGTVFGEVYGGKVKARVI
jgi:hypothetical protein